MKSRILTRCGFFVQFGDRALPPYSFFRIFNEISVLPMAHLQPNIVFVWQSLKESY